MTKLYSPKRNEDDVLGLTTPGQCEDYVREVAKTQTAGSNSRRRRRAVFARSFNVVELVKADGEILE